MTVHEGGVPKDDLSKYVERVFAQRAEREADFKGLKDAEDEERLKLYIQKTTPLRTHLLQLATPIELLLEKFNVRGLLEEARGILSEYTPKAFDPNYYVSPEGYKTGWWPVARRNLVVEKILPPVYQKVVIDPQIIESISIGEEVIDLDALANPDNFGKVIPDLKGYGLALTSTRKDHINSMTEQSVWISGSGGGYSGYYVGGERVWRSGTRGYWGKDYSPASVPIMVTKTMLVEAIKSEPGKEEYDLLYSHRIRREDLRTKKDGHPLDRVIELTPPIRISSLETAETLRKLIGDDVIKELDGDYEKVFYQLVNWGIRRSGKEGFVINQEGFSNF